MLSITVSMIFLSTPSARRATFKYFVKILTASFLSTPSARRATTINQLRQAFQIQFLSTPSARRATDFAGLSYHARYISIHALREEGD